MDKLEQPIRLVLSLADMSQLDDVLCGLSEIEVTVSGYYEIVDEDMNIVASGLIRDNVVVSSGPQVPPVKLLWSVMSG